MFKKNHLLTLFIGLASFSCFTEKQDYLVKIQKNQPDPVGYQEGYINASGDTVAPLGKYAFCLSDTVRTLGFVIKQGGGCAAIDPTGKELFDVFWYDNGPDPVSEGLFRIQEGGKIGFADEQGRIVIAPQFECASPFQDGKARVAYSCTLVPDGEHTIAESESWIFIDKKGNKINGL